MYIHKRVLQPQWDGTIVGDLLGKDAESLGGNVLLTLNLPHGHSHGHDASAGNSVPLTVPAPIPMEIDDDDNDKAMKRDDEPAPVSVPSVDVAVQSILSQNFDSDSKECLLTCLKIMDNILIQPTMIAKRSLRLGNNAIQKRIGAKKGGLDLLLALGFEGDGVSDSASTRGGSGFDFDNSLARSAASTSALAAVTDEDANSNAMIVLRPRDDQSELQHLHQVRGILVQVLKDDLNMSPNDIPVLKRGGNSNGGGGGAVGGTAVNKSAAAKPAPAALQSFDPFKSHSYNTQAAAVGANPNAIIPDDADMANVNANANANANSSSRKSTTERKLELMQEKQKSLEDQLQPSKYLSLDERNIVAYLPGQVGPIVSLNDGGDTGSGSTSTKFKSTKGDGSLIANQIKRKMEERKKREEGGFTTKAMRELEQMKKAKVYSHAQLRIYFPDGSRIEGKFLPNEKIGTVKNVIASTFLQSASSAFSSSPLESTYASCLHPFDLYISPPRRILAEDKSLKQEGLVPAAKIHVSWKNSTTTSSISMSTLIQSCFFPASASSNDNNISSFPESKSVVDNNNKKRGNAGNMASASAASKGNELSSEADKAAREEELMQKMLGKRKGLGFGLGGKFGKNKSKGSGSGSGTAGGNDKKSSSSSGGKPKWLN